ncbi:MAG: hypothetical protein R2794_03030 [Chitinophagales bacterium]
MKDTAKSKGNTGKKVGRPAVREPRLIDGIYIMVKNKGSDEKGIKIRCADERELEIMVERYRHTKDITLLGEYRNNVKVA